MVRTGRLMRALTLFSVVALATAGVTITLPQAPAYAVDTAAVFGPNENVKLGTAIVTGGATSAALDTAKGEFESFQIVVRRSTAITNLVVNLDHSLTGPGGKTIPAANLSFYREEPFSSTADTRTDGESAQGPGGDALVPEKDYIYGQDRGKFHRRVAANQRVVIWVDVFTNRGQAVGDYSGGSIRILDGATVLHAVPLSVHVRNFVLPATSTLKSAFFDSDYNSYCQAHTGLSYCGFDGTKVMRFEALYARVALENRITIANPWGVGNDRTLTNTQEGEDLTTPFRQYVVPVIRGGTLDPSLGKFRLTAPKATSLAFYWQCETACINAWKAEATTDGFRPLLHYYVCDEPNGSVDRWAECNQRHVAVSGPSGLPELVTASMTTATSTGGNAQNWIDTFVTGIEQMAAKSGAYSGDHRPDYQTWLTGADPDAVKNELWLYSACSQGGCNGPTSSPTRQDPPWNDAEWNGWAGYGIDQPGSQARAMSWLAYRYTATGELYYNTTEKLSKAWSACTNVTHPLDGVNAPDQDSDCLYTAGVLGDGTLFYPGKACPVSTTDLACIGGQDDIPLESIRLKRIRDGREDFEYLQLAKKVDPVATMAVVTQLFGPTAQATFSTTVSQASINDARRQLANLLDPTAIAVADASVTEGSGGGTTTMTFPVTRTGGTAGTSQVTVSTADATATLGSDFAAPPTTVSFAAGETTKAVVVPVTADSLVEPDETFTVTLSNPTGAVLADGSAIGTIVNDDVATYRPDGRIRTATGTYLGNGIYNSTGAGQTITTTLARGTTQTFYLAIGNDGNVADSYSLAEAGADAPGVTRQYFYGATDVTAAIDNGTYSTGSKAAGNEQTFRLVVTADAGAQVGSSGQYCVHTVSFVDPGHVRDVVCLTVSVG